MQARHIQGYLVLFALVLLVGCATCGLTGCAYQRYDTITKVELPAGGTFSLPKGGALVNVEVTKNAGTVEKSTPLDFLRGLGQGSAISAAPGGSATQSGTATQDNSGAKQEPAEACTTNPETPQSAIRPSTGLGVSDNPQSAIRDPQSLSPAEILQSLGATSIGSIGSIPSLPSSTGETPVLPAGVAGIDKKVADAPVEPVIPDSAPVP